MRPRLILMATLLVTAVPVPLVAQMAVGPVAPRQSDGAPRPASVYERALTKALDADVDGRWWERADDKERVELLENLEALRMKVQSPVGPVPPRTPPRKPPTKRDVDEALTQLRDALKQAGTAIVSPDAAPGLNALIAQLNKRSMP